MNLAATPNAQQHLDSTIFEIRLERHKRKPFLVGEAGKSGNLPPVQQKFAGSLGLMVELIGFFALDNGFVIACGSGAVRITRAQRAGKGAQDAETFLRGMALPQGTVLGSTSGAH